MCLPGRASIPAVDARRGQAAEATGRRAVDMALSGPKPSEILTKEAFDNAITLLMAVGGSTNAVVHLLALARRVGYDLQLDRFHEISQRTPRIANVRPSMERRAPPTRHSRPRGGSPARQRTYGVSPPTTGADGRPFWQLPHPVSTSAMRAATRMES